MRNMLRIMANTIVANLCTTRHVGLMDGKTGLCLFLHEYGRYMSAPFYTALPCTTTLLCGVFVGFEITAYLTAFQA